ncbi:hypothetical protein D9758_010337 [Tetrapyrgos nigripes]|uniref:BTB domain-containing protein n=1 Tax=Tetrapyrgos nigripes TaxID=182062 RepID=A0A8H5D110_9AGAR|nr:hypothetical protein D9758_010337 [Tetrapyrgos nigripes]
MSLSATVSSGDSTGSAPAVSKILTCSKPSPAVNAETGGDIVFRSLDNVLFYVHSKNLEFLSEGFPSSEHTIPPEDPVDLTEDSITLEFLFQFTYHRMPPDLDELGFDGLMKLAEAADKYGIHFARGFCVQELRRFTGSKGIEIFEFACHHGYEKLIYELAPLLVHRPLSQFAHKIPASVYVPWSLYHDQFEQPLSRTLATEYLSLTKPYTYSTGRTVRIPPKCIQPCTTLNHNSYWSEKLEDWRRRIVDESLPCCAINAMLNQTYFTFPAEYRAPCCFGFQDLRERLKELSQNGPDHRTLQDFVKEYREGKVRQQLLLRSAPTFQCLLTLSGNQWKPRARRELRAKKAHIEWI